MLPPVGISSLCYNKLYLFENGSLSLINCSWVHISTRDTVFRSDQMDQLL